jgi:peptide/nickel transport system permease protein
LDGQGRDILTRLMWGGRVSIPIALVPVTVSTFVSLVLGLIAGYFKGVVGELIMRVLDVFYAFPTVMLAIAIAGIMGPGMMNVMLSICIVLVPYITRVVYTTTLVVSEQDFVEAARASGASDLQIVFGQILPNVLSPIIVYGTTTMGLQIVFASGLSFLGLGVQPPVADWGIMTANGRDVLQIAPHVSTVPGVLLLLVALSFNLLGDGLRDALDPRLRL